MVATLKKFEKWHIRYISDMKTTLFLLSNCLMCGIAVMGIKHLVLTRTGDLLTTGETGKYGFGSWSCIWPRHANSCLQMYSSLPEFNWLM